MKAISCGGLLQAIQQAQVAKSQAPPALADPADAAAGARVRAFLEDVTTLHYCRAGVPLYWPPDHTLVLACCSFLVPFELQPACPVQHALAHWRTSSRSQRSRLDF